MEVKGIFYSAKSEEEIERAITLGIETPEPVELKLDLLFRLKDVKRAHRSETGNILLIFEDDDKFEILFDQAVWEQLRQLLT